MKVEDLAPAAVLLAIVMLLAVVGIAILDVIAGERLFPVVMQVLR